MSASILIATHSVIARQRLIFYSYSYYATPATYQYQLNQPNFKDEIMTIAAFKPNWMDEEIEMLHESALKFFKGWEQHDEKWRANGMLDRAKWVFCVRRYQKNTAARAAIFVMKRRLFMRRQKLIK